ncbi:MAG: ADP-ribosylglycohydrolase family protein [Planctomycetes bacterium]|nr:ADP-ribosylglycohydrolase family protein [Planctomycetota bacterium]
MRTSGERFDSRFRAAFLGAAVGDALGFPYKDYSRGFLESVARPLTESFERDARGCFPPGQITDETQTALAVSRAILEGGEVRGDLVVDYLIPLWRDLTVVDADPDTSEAMHELVRGAVDWRESGLPAGRASCGALSRAIPVGLWDCASPERIPRDAERVTRVTHNDPRVVGAGAGLAAAIASNLVSDELILGPFLDRVSQAAGAFHEPLAEAVLDVPRLLSQSDLRAREIIESVLADPLYLPRDDGVSDYVIQPFFLALYHFLKTPNSFEETVSLCLRLGGRVDALLAAAGALAGSFNGMEAIPASLIEHLVSVEDIREAAGDLLIARERPVAARARADRGGGEEGPS